MHPWYEVGGTHLSCLSGLYQYPIFWYSLITQGAPSHWNKLCTCHRDISWCTPDMRLGEVTSRDWCPPTIRYRELIFWNIQDFMNISYPDTLWSPCLVLPPETDHVPVMWISAGAPLIWGRENSIGGVRLLQKCTKIFFWLVLSLFILWVPAGAPSMRGMENSCVRIRHKIHLSIMNNPSHVVWFTITCGCPVLDCRLEMWPLSYDIFPIHSISLLLKNMKVTAWCYFFLKTWNYMSICHN